MNSSRKSMDILTYIPIDADSTLYSSQASKLLFTSISTSCIKRLVPVRRSKSYSSHDEQAWIHAFEHVPCSMICEYIKCANFHSYSLSLRIQTLHFFFKVYSCCKTNIIQLYLTAIVLILIYISYLVTSQLC